MATVIDPQPGTGETTSSVTAGRLPLTERVLQRLGAPRWLWIGLWASTAIIAPGVLVGVLAIQGELVRVTGVQDLLVAQAVIGYVVIVSIWGVGRISRQLLALEPDLVRLTNSVLPRDGLSRFTTTLPPIVLTAIFEVVNTIGTWNTYGAAAALAVLPFLTLSLVPIMTFVWTYLQLLIGLDRLGRARLTLDLFPQDRSLGLGPVGAVAFNGFIIVWAIVIPILIGNQNLPTLAASVGIVAILVALFFLSMWRLHRQMSAAKARYIAQTRDLFTQAYEPVRRSNSLEALSAQAPLLGPAQALEERAERILEWPIDEGMTARVAIILTGIVTGLLLRFIQIAAHL